MAVKFSALREGRSAFIAEEDFWYSFILEAETSTRTKCGWKD
jgi:hypothetical protein